MYTSPDNFKCKILIHLFSVSIYVNLWIETLQIHGDAAVAEVFFHLGDGVILEVGDGGHQDRIGVAVDDGVVEVIERSGSAGGDDGDIDGVGHCLIQFVVVAGLRAVGVHTRQQDFTSP
jgi:hypothetical protein